MPRPIHATIHTAHLSHNLQAPKNKAPNSRLWATVKANAYGHGIRHVYEALRAADGFAVLDLDEAALLRELGCELGQGFHVAIPLTEQAAGVWLRQRRGGGSVH